MRVEKKEGEYWITNTPSGVEEMGPYNSKKEAEEDCAGVKRMLKELEKPLRKGRGKPYGVL